MSSNAKRRRLNNPDRVYESGTRHHQRRFAARRKTTRRVPLEPLDLEQNAAQQSTLTQLKDFSNSFSSDDAEPALEEKNAEYKGNELQNNRADEEIPDSEDEENHTPRERQRTLTQWDGFFTPETFYLPKQTREEESSARKGKKRERLTAERRNQQSLTQMPDWLHGEEFSEDNEEAGYEDFGEDMAASAESVAVPDATAQTPDVAPVTTHKPGRTHDRLGIQFKVPQTPKRWTRTREVPSSQSPPDAPLSTQKTERFRSPDVDDPSDSPTPETPTRPRVMQRAAPDQTDQDLTPVQIKEESTWRQLPSSVPDSQDDFSDDTEGEEDSEDWNSLMPREKDFVASERQVGRNIKREIEVSQDRHRQPFMSTSQTELNLDSATDQDIGARLSMPPPSKGSPVKDADYNAISNSVTLSQQSGSREAARQIQDEFQSYTQRRSSRTESSGEGTATALSKESVRSKFRAPHSSISRPSQATTVDITQHTPPHLDHETQFSLAPPPLIIPSSPASLGPLPSSLLHSPTSSQGTPTRNIGWDSQFPVMVPDSMDEYSFPAPPIWTQEDDR